MTATAADFLKVPPASVAAPKGCIRVTILNRKRGGLTTIFRLDDIPLYMEGVTSAIDLENDDPAEVMKVVASSVKKGRIDDVDAPFIGLITLWVAKHFDRGISNAIDILTEATGRVVLLARERKGPTAIRATWDFRVGVETGVNEGRPVGHPSTLEYGANRP